MLKIAQVIYQGGEAKENMLQEIPLVLLYYKVHLQTTSVFKNSLLPYKAVEMLLQLPLKISMFWEQLNSVKTITNYKVLKIITHCYTYSFCNLFDIVKYSRN